MNGLILCNHKRAKHPLYIEELGIHIFTGEELCYVIYHHLFPVQEKMINHKLAEFIRDELDYRDLAEKIDIKLKDVKKTDEILMDILKDIPYFSLPELSQFRDYLGRIKRMNLPQLLFEKANYYMGRKRYRISIKYCEEILKYDESQINSDEGFLGRTWSQLAKAYVNLFEFQSAVEAYEKAYEYGKEKSILKKIFFLTQIQENLKVSENISNRITLEKRMKWGEELAGIQSEVMAGGRVVEVSRLFQKDSIRRREGTGYLFHNWKAEYRNMV